MIGRRSPWLVPSLLLFRAPIPLFLSLPLPLLSLPPSHPPASLRFPSLISHPSSLLVPFSPLPSPLPSPSHLYAHAPLFSRRYRASCVALTGTSHLYLAAVDNPGAALITLDARAFPRFQMYPAIDTIQSPYYGLVAVSDSEHVYYDASDRTRMPLLWYRVRQDWAADQTMTFGINGAAVVVVRNFSVVGRMVYALVASATAYERWLLTAYQLPFLRDPVRAFSSIRCPSYCTSGTCPCFLPKRGGGGRIVIESVGSKGAHASRAALSLSLCCPLFVLASAVVGAFKCIPKSPLPPPPPSNSGVALSREYAPARPVLLMPGPNAFTACLRRPSSLRNACSIAFILALPMSRSLLFHLPALLSVFHGVNQRHVCLSPRRALSLGVLLPA